MVTATSVPAKRSLLGEVGRPEPARQVSTSDHGRAEMSDRRSGVEGGRIAPAAADRLPE